LVVDSTGNLIMNETDPASLMKESHPASPGVMENEVRILIPEIPLRAVESTASTEVDGHEAYEQGSVLKNVGLFKQAAEHFQKAAQDPSYALKGLAQMGLCLKQSGKQEEAVMTFRRALQIPTASSKEQVQILYLLGRTLESLGRIPEALEAYRWLRREAPQYRDVAMRIESLSTRRMHPANR
jgi:tetratricopeptide (TPR) repeat protein